MNLVPHTVMVEICGWRDAAIAKMSASVDQISQGFEGALSALNYAEKAYGSAAFVGNDRSRTSSYQDLFQNFQSAASLEAFRQQVDARVWMHLLERTGTRDLMDRTAKEELYASLSGDVPEINEDNIRATFTKLAGDSKLIFQRGLARAFSSLDRRFKSHNAFKLGSRIILTRVFGDFGWNCHSEMGSTLADVERVFNVLDGEKPNVGGLEAAIRESRGGYFSAPMQSVLETSLFKIKTYKNGNVHLWFKRDDLVEKANLVLADYYGEVLPDAVPDDRPVADIKSKGGALSTNLAFYATPLSVAHTAIRLSDIESGHRVLEPSAGEGGLVRPLVAAGAVVDAIEVHPDRCCILRSIGSDVNVLEANFLRVTPTPTYSHVVMNPPFSGTHWMEHILHAFEFLEPGGRLTAILPVTAELGTSRKHQTFTKWANLHEGRWLDLPAESFAVSGTRVSTVVFTARKERVR